ncbi:MAG: lactoylglutathione lyase [Crocinitomicaceae bacterium]|jgi:predicted enzyme related to lactoylglutathione lyase|nr:lactoylglutathione lyase [Crocinitomicaceae bacterium]
MKQTTLIALVIIASFGLGFGFKTIISKDEKPELKRVTGIGGIFFKCKDPKKLRAWYETHLGLSTNDYGAVFEWHQGADSTKKGFTQWSPFIETTKYFGAAEQKFMINYRVHDLEALVKQLEKEGVTIVDKLESYDYGKFVHITDLEGNRIELWEPNDVVYEKMGVDMGAKTVK